MAEQHRATADQWDLIGRKLRDRVEALEAAAKPHHPANPDGSLVERVAAAITGGSDEPINWKPEARAAIREVAAWLRDHYGGTTASTDLLEQEAER